LAPARQEVNTELTQRFMQGPITADALSHWVEAKRRS
jgi:hypothetical protein